MPRYRLNVAYDGTRFHGWQQQFTLEERGLPAAIPPMGKCADGRVELRTVQGVLQQAVREVVNEPVIVMGASRTDAGVHAAAQCAAFTVNTDRRPPDHKLVQAINARLPEDVLITAAVRTNDDFDPIKDCLSKGYRYTIHSGSMKPLWTRRTAWWTYHKLDPALMHEGAQHLVGEHDFASFAQINHGRETTVRTIFACDVTSERSENAAFEEASKLVHIDVSGNGFLYNMVRIIAGTLLDIGRGRWKPEQVKDIIAHADRTAAGPTLGPEGLRLEWIKYS